MVEGEDGCSGNRSCPGSKHVPKCLEYVSVVETSAINMQNSRVPNFTPLQQQRRLPHTRPAHFFWRLWNIFCSFPASYSSSPSNRLKRHLGHKSVCTHCLFSMHCRCFTWTERNKITQSMSWDEFVIDHYFDHKSNLFWHHYESWTNHIFFPITFEIAFNLRHFVQLLGAIWEPNQPWEPHLPS